MTRTRQMVRQTIITSIIIYTFMLLWLTSVGVDPRFTFFWIAATAILTAVMSVFLIGYREYLQRRAFAGKKQSSTTTEAQQERTIEIDLPFEAAFDLAQRALQTLDQQKVPLPDDPLVRLESLLPRHQRLRVYKTDRNMGRIEAGLRGRVLGIPDLQDFSRIAIQLQRLDAQTTRLHIESRANTVFDLYDMGKNLHYVNELALFLRRESQQEQATARLATAESPDQTADTPQAEQQTKRNEQ